MLRAKPGQRFREVYTHSTVPKLSCAHVLRDYRSPTKHYWGASVVLGWASAAKGPETWSRQASWPRASSAIARLLLGVRRDAPRGARTRGAAAEPHDQRLRSEPGKAITIHPGDEMQMQVVDQADTLAEPALSTPSSSLPDAEQVRHPDGPDGHAWPGMPGTTRRPRSSPRRLAAARAATTTTLLHRAPQHRQRVLHLRPGRYLGSPRGRLRHLAAAGVEHRCDEAQLHREDRVLLVAAPLLLGGHPAQRAGNPALPRRRAAAAPGCRTSTPTGLLGNQP